MKIVFIIFCVLILGCTSETDQSKSVAKESERTPAKFEPADGECILFVGQELEAIGGLDDWNDGYLDHFETPGGFTMYTNFSPGDSSFGYLQKGFDGIYSLDDWGDSPSHLNLQLSDPDFAHMALAIGLAMVNHEDKVASGEHDWLIDSMGHWLLTMGDRPVFLRIGYEFSGAWNHYNREDYIKAYRRIKDRLDVMGVENVAYVWQSHGCDEPMELLESWYPGDEYVDWCAYSFFSRWDEANMIEFARKKGKPVFIAEATPTISTETVKTTGKTKETILSNAQQAEEAWQLWFEPFFNTIDSNPNIVKAVSYINCNWKSHRMWFDNPTFQDVDARLQMSDSVSHRWRERIADEKYLKASPQLFNKLWQTN